MAKNLLFNSFNITLDSITEALFEIGVGDTFKVEYDALVYWDEAAGDSCNSPLVCCDHVTEDGITFKLRLMHLDDFEVIATENAVGEFGKSYHIEMGRIANTKDYIKIDGVEVATKTEGLEAISLYGDFGWFYLGTGYYNGTLKNAKITKNDVVILDMPFNGDYADHSAYEWETQIIDTDNPNPILYYVEDAEVERLVQSRRTIINVGEFIDYTGSLGAILAGDISGYGATKTGGSLLFPVSVEAGKTITSAKLRILSSYSWFGFSGTGAKAAIRGVLDNTPEQFTSLADYLTARAENSTSPIVFNDVELPYDTAPLEVNVKPIIDEIYALGAIENVLLFVDDHEGNSDANKIYRFFYLELKIETDGGTPSTSKKIMIKRN